MASNVGQIRFTSKQGCFYSLAYFFVMIQQLRITVR